MKGKYKKLSLNVFLFSISSFGQKILAFLLVPLYTNYLSLSQYGTIDLLTTTISLIIPILTLNIAEAVMRFTIDDKKNDAYVTYGMIIIVKGTFVLTIILCILGFMPFFKKYSTYFFIIGLVFVLHALYALMQNYLRATDNIGLMVISSLLNSAVMLVLDIILIAKMGLGIKGYYIAMIVSSFVSIILMEIGCSFHKHLRLNIYRSNISIRQECLKYSIPTIFTALAWWINSSLDRYFVTGMCGVDANGIYSISYKIPTILGIFQTIFTQAWTLSAIVEFDKDDSDGFFGKTYEMFNFMMILGTAMIMLLNNFLASILYAKEFYIAWKYVPLLLISSLFSALSGYIGGIFSAAKDTKTCAYSTVASAGVNIVLNTILIPYIGIYGAAIATMISYICAWGIRIIVSRKYIRMKISIKKDIFVYGLLIIQTVLAMSSSRYYLLQILIVFCIIGLYTNVWLEIVSKISKLTQINIFKFSDK